MQKPANNRDCSYIRNHLFSYQENKLSDGELKTFKDHLHGCPDCSRILSNFQVAISGIEGKKSVQPDPFIQTRILQRVESNLERMRSKSHIQLLRILGTISVSFLILGASIIGFSVIKQRDTTFTESINHERNIQAIKSELNFPDFVDEELPFSDNH